MRDPLRLPPVHPQAAGRWPPLAQAPPQAAEIAAHVAGQVATASEPVRPAELPRPHPESLIADSNRRHAEERPEVAPRRTHGGRACVETARSAPPQHDAEENVRPGSRERPEPFHPVAPFGRPDEAQRAAMVRLVDAIGLHLVCPERRCRRAKSCRDPDPAQLPLCVWLHRGTCRFVLACLAGRAENGELADDGAAPSGHAGGAGESLLGDLERAGWPIERLARTREDGADEWSWEAEPEMCALVDAFRRPAGTGP